MSIEIRNYPDVMQFKTLFRDYVVVFVIELLTALEREILSGNEVDLLANRLKRIVAMACEGECHLCFGRTVYEVVVQGAPALSYFQKADARPLVTRNPFNRIFLVDREWFKRAIAQPSIQFLGYEVDRACRPIESTGDTTIGGFY